MTDLKTFAINKLFKGKKPKTQTVVKENLLQTVKKTIRKVKKGK